jgi:hypothetical protein
MHGLGTDEANLIRVLATKTNDQIIELNRRFNQRYGHKGDLNKWIDGKANICRSDMLSLCARPPAAVAVYMAA